MGQSEAHQREKEEKMFATYISLWPLLQARTHMGAAPHCPYPMFQFGVSGFNLRCLRGGLVGEDLKETLL